MSQLAGGPAARREAVGEAASSSGPPGDEAARAGPTTLEEAAADAIAAAVGAGDTVLVVGSPPPGLGDALDGRGCQVTLLGPPGPPVAEAWTARVGTVDEVRPDPGTLDGYDAVVAPHLLDLAADPAASLRRVAGALRPKGLVVLVAAPVAPPGALHRHDAAQVERLCELAGLAVQAVTAVPERRPGEHAGDMAADGLGPRDASVMSTPASASAAVVVARRVAAAPSPGDLDDGEPARAVLTVAVDRRLREQRAMIRALEDEVRALRKAGGRARLAAVLSRGSRFTRRVRVIRKRMRARG